MSAQLLTVKAALQIQKPAEEVFEAIVDPAKMSNYFISKGSGRIEEGKEVIWKFPEFEIEFPVKAKKVETNKYISFYWGEEGKELLVEMTLTPQKDNATLLRITETGMENNETGIKWLIGNTEGWANFLACLKAYLEYGINLRKGGFDYINQG